ncbi:hypothetical protein BIV60_09815 [Bacillus sp. MUM 116]|uniref:hypothetical protein n=1 Tax=Bacillus sp. MUM 116 TaxID=1678002 RepID=UPI0008F5EAD5|nr:hypothetical protein [Bacillus sp. MUM 116]OIK15437.1 hypothetical protein BIV60_09815 [Bacillus sp. MUM 116]
MFDPTAFDNMKVVIEGAIYDLDLGGEIVITDRNDIINMAKMSRIFEISFKMTETIKKSASVKISLESSMINLAAELIPGMKAEKMAGSSLKLEFFFESVVNQVDYDKIEKLFSDIWGPSRKISQRVQLDPLYKESEALHTITVEFDRIIQEAQLDDLIDMIEYIITSVKRLELLI